MNREEVMAIVRLIVPLVVYAAALAGVAIDADLVYCVLLIVCGIAATVWTWWKNNNVTAAAQEAQIYLDAIKAGYSDTEKVAEILADFDAYNKAESEGE